MQSTVHSVQFYIVTYFILIALIAIYVKLWKIYWIIKAKNGQRKDNLRLLTIFCYNSSNTYTGLKKTHSKKVMQFQKDDFIQNHAFLTGALVKIGTNGLDDGVTPIFFNMKCLYDIWMNSKIFDPQSLCSPKKLPFFALTWHFHLKI